MGWICKACGTENAFFVTHCPACGTKVNNAFIQRETLRAKRELLHYKFRLKRRMFFGQELYRRLVRFNRTVCRSMAVLLVLSLMIAAVFMVPWTSNTLQSKASSSFAEITHCFSARSSMLTERFGYLQWRLATLINRGNMNALCIAQIHDQNVLIVSDQWDTVIGRFGMLARKASANRATLTAQSSVFSIAIEKAAARADMRLNNLNRSKQHQLEQLQAKMRHLDSPEAVWQAIVDVF